MPNTGFDGVYAMKAVIVAGGLGSRLQEETSLRPKPMVDIGGKAILWHSMNIYAAHNVRDFVLALGLQRGSNKKTIS